MPEGAATLMDAARHYLASLSDKERIASQAEVERFVRWCGADRSCDQLRGQDVANYAETLTGTVTDATRRADAVRQFLAYAKKAGFTATNLGTPPRLAKDRGGAPRPSRPGAQGGRDERGAEGRSCGRAGRAQGA